MPVPSRAELAQLLGEDAPTEEAWFLQAATAWQSLRILERLGAEGPATTGDLARALNVDMSDVRERLDALSEAGLVERADDRWALAVDGYGVSVGLADGLAIDHRLDSPAAPPGEEATDAGGDVATPGQQGDPDSEGDDGPFARAGRRIDALLFG